MIGEDMNSDSYDIIVAGGGMAGCAAAIAAARSGFRTLIIENFGFLGGWATAALVNPFMTHRTSDGKPLIAGLFDEINSRLAILGGLLVNSFDPEAMMFALQEMVLESGADIRLHALCEEASIADSGEIVVLIRSKSGEEEIRCRRLIDCTGDGDLAVSLGARFETGDEQGLPQAATLMFDVGGVDLEKALQYVKDNPDQMRFPKLSPDADPAVLADGIISVAGYYQLIEQARAAGDYNAPGDLIFYIGRPRKGEVTFNTTHIGGVNGIDAGDLTRAEIEGRRQMMSIVAFVKKYVPGFEHAFLLRSAAHVGIRETRRIIGEYVFNGADVTHARKFDDAICRLAYPVDVHSGKGEGYTKDEEQVTGPQIPPAGDWYEIPYRCMVPLGLENVLVAGRCVSSTQAGHGAIRIMPACVAMGEAAGTAAGLSLKDGVTPRNIDPGKMRELLKETGSLL
ncbi:MAG: FAD-dependent oxidoreductase [Armatimonadota bacterium]|nr:FAD-dependent oxidoreductase [bacterium]